MRNRSLVLLLTAALSPLPAQTDALPFATGTLTALRERAKAERKALVIDFSVDTIEPCRRLLQTTWRDDELRRWLESNAFAARIDPEQDTAAAKEFALTAYPTIVVLGSDGAEVDRIVGYVDAVALRERLVKRVHTHSTNHRERTKLADQLASEGDLDGALEHYLWLWDHGEEHNAGFGGVRLSFFVTKLSAFAKRHPPAQRALQERRDALAQRVGAGETQYDLVKDLVALCKVLDSNDLLVVVFDKAPAASWARQAISRRVMVQAAIEPLVLQHKYAGALRLAGDPVEFFEAHVKPLGDVPLPAEMRRGMAEHTVVRQGPLLEACFGARHARTEQLVARLFEIDGSTKAWLMVLNAARRAENDVACHDYAVRALQELPDSEHDAVRQFLKKK